MGGDQAAIDRVAEVGQIEPAEGAVPVGAVALAAIELAAGRPRGSRGRRAGRAEAAASRREMPSIRAYISSLSAYRALKFRQNPPARKNGLSRSASAAGGHMGFCPLVILVEPRAGSTHSVISRYEPSGR